MALADTAALISSLELQDKFSKPIANAERALGSFERRSGSLDRIGAHLSSGLNSAVTNLTRVGVAGGVFLASQIKFGVDALQRLDNANAQTIAGLKSTAGASGQTLQSIRDLAEGYEALNATIDDKVIQSAENLLLTFPAITGKAFKPALEAALDLNTALGGGEGGLQNTIIQVGKALQDPVRGLTSLRRVGVAFTPEQEKQIKALVKQNDLYGAQRIILAELSKEFGGRFAAAGNTATGTFAKLGDAIEDLQIALAQALLPAVTEVAGEINKFLRDPAVIRSVQDFGKGLADGFREAVKWAKTLDLSGIASGLKTAAGLAGDLISAFTKAPPWVQQLAVGGFILNKATGGAVVDIGADITKGLISGLTGKGGLFGARGQTPATPLFVADVTGGKAVPGAVAGNAAGGIKSILTFGAALGIATVALDKWQNELVPLNDAIAKQTTDIAGRVQNSLKTATLSDLDTQLRALSQASNDLEANIGGLGPAAEVLYGSQRKTLRDSIAAIEAELQARRLAQTFDERNAQAASTAFDRLEGAANPLSRTLDQLRSSASRLRDANLALFHEAARLRGGRVSSAALSGILAQRGPVAQTATTIAAAMTLALKQGGVGNIVSGIRELKALQARFISQGDTKSAAKIGGDIRTLTGVLRAKKLSLTNRITIPVAATISVRGVIAQTTSIRLYSSNQYVES